MVIDMGVSSYAKMRVSSFVQMRGSVPSQWSQDISKMVAKPAITFNISDPFYEIAGLYKFSVCSYMAVLRLLIYIFLQELISTNYFVDMVHQ